MVDRVIVVGAGIGGLSAAIHLALAGQRVTVLEQGSAVGGKMAELQEGGFRWDTGPSVITLPDVLTESFGAAGRRADDYFNLLPLEPLTRYFYPDGTVLDLGRDLAQTLGEIEALDPKDVDGYLRFLAYAARMYRITAPISLYGEPLSVRNILRVPIRQMAQVDFRRTMNQAIRSYARSPHLRQLLGRFATYLGASPYQARAFYNVIAYVELGAGLWYPQGGVYAVARAYRRLAEELGVEVRTNSPVTRIQVEDGAATGVALADGTYERAAAVISNVDATRTYLQLLPSQATSTRRVARLSRGPFSCSGFLLLLGVEGTDPRLAHHNIFFSSDYRREFDDIFAKGIPPLEPTIYVAITAKTDPEHAPQGAENWFVMVNTPPLTPGWDWEAQAGSYRQRVLDRLAQFGFDVRQRIRVERALTPVDLERLTGAWRGALYGLSFNHPLASFRRPHNRSPEVRSLYLAGGTAHPGGGVPLVTLSGKLAARLALQGLGG